MKEVSLSFVFNIRILKNNSIIIFLYLTTKNSKIVVDFFLCSLDDLFVRWIIKVNQWTGWKSSTSWLVILCIRCSIFENPANIVDGSVFWFLKSSRSAKCWRVGRRVLVITPAPFASFFRWRRQIFSLWSFLHVLTFRRKDRFGFLFDYIKRVIEKILHIWQASHQSAKVSWKLGLSVDAELDFHFLAFLD